MSKLKINFSEVLKKNLKIVSYLLVSGGLGWVLATHVVDNPALAVVFAPAINFVLYQLALELKNEGYVEAVKNR